MKRPCLTALASVLVAIPVVAQQPAASRPTVAAAERGSTDAAESARRARLIRSALSAGPRTITEGAAVLAPGADGKLVELRAGTNGWTCMPDMAETPHADPMCLDREGMRWATSWMNKEARPASTVPGIGYMLQGGSDISATDPWATTTDRFIASPPHWMLLWAPDSGSGLPTTPKKTGAWIMWAGTPYAHIMINQVP